MNSSELMAMGYRVISRKYGMLGRIDRLDWKEDLIKRFRFGDMKDGNAWIKAMGEASAEDFYRRMTPKCQITVSKNISDKMENSNWAITGFINTPLSGKE